MRALRLSRLQTAAIAKAKTKAAAAVHLWQKSQNTQIKRQLQRFVAEVEGMDIGGKIWTLLGKRENLIHIFLAGSFLALSIRSVGQQNDIEALQSEKEALQTTNKSMKKAMWDWKQQLFREAAESEAPPVPLSRLQAIYGDHPTLHQQEQGAAAKADSTSKSKFVV